MTEPPESKVPMIEAGVVFVMEVADRPGIVHAIAAVFAHRGLSMSTLGADTHRKPSRILVQFQGTQRQCRMVEQVLTRLHDVHSIRSLPEDAEEIREVAMCHALAPLPASSDVQIQQAGDRHLLSGSRAAVEAALQRFTAAGLIDEVSRSLLVP